MLIETSQSKERVVACFCCSKRERAREREREGRLTFELFQLQQNQTNLSMDEVGANSPYSWGRYVKTFFIVSYNLKIKAEPGADMINKF